MTLDSAGLPGIPESAGLPGIPESAGLPGIAEPHPPERLPGPTPPAGPRRSRSVPRSLRFPGPLLAAALSLLLALPLLTAAHHARPTPYGDHLTVHARVRHITARTAPQQPTTAQFRTRGTGIEAYDARTGATHWRYTREGRRPLTSLHARGEVITLWDDGMVTDTDGRSVRWHRALPAADDWLPAHGGAGVLRPLGRGILAVVTPHRVAAYRIADGDLRWVLPAREGCAFEPERAVRHGKALIVAQPCPRAAWTAQLIALDDLGRITPHRRPLGNEVVKEGHGPRSEHANAEKVVARPR